MSLNSTRTKRILGLTLPIIGAQLSFNVLNIVDTAMVANVGITAIAAVGLSAFAFYMTQFFFVGLANGVQTFIARKKGESQAKEMAKYFNGGLVLSILIGIPFTLLFFNLADPIIGALSKDAKVVEIGSEYFQFRTLSYVGLGLIFTFRGLWAAIEKSKYYLISTILMHVVNIILNYVLIYGKYGFAEYGAVGSGIATLIATYFGLLFNVVFLIFHRKEIEYSLFFPSLEEIKKLFLLSLPNGIQQLFFWAGMTAFIWIVGHSDTTRLAIANMLMNIGMFASLSALGFGIGASTLVSEALGRNALSEAREWVNDTVRLCFIFMLVICLSLMLFYHVTLKSFLVDEIAYEMAIVPFFIFCVTMLAEAPLFVYMQAIVGSGDTKKIMKISVFSQWLCFLPIILLMGQFLSSFIAIWVVFSLYRIGQAFWFFKAWDQVQLQDQRI